MRIDYFDEIRTVIFFLDPYFLEHNVMMILRNGRNFMDLGLIRVEVLERRRLVKRPKEFVINNRIVFTILVAHLVSVNLC